MQYLADFINKVLDTFHLIISLLILKQRFLLRQIYLLPDICQVGLKISNFMS